VKKFTVTLRKELQRDNTLDEIESLLSDFLEEVKLNYVKNLSEDEIQELLPIVKQPPQLTGS
jgi:DNA-directed RNA polymerase specialized sigma24 family protein